VTRVPVPYAGLATRAVALAVDAAIAQAIVFTGGAILALVASLASDVQLESTVARAVAGAAWALIVGGYFVLFWSTAGQTPGMRLMKLRVVTRGGVHPGVGRSCVRLVGLVLAIVPLFAGFLPVLIDDRRRALQDFLAGTVVLYADRDPLPEPAVAPARPAPAVGPGRPTAAP
jgi:uncharacterized RDD family membrane protein YckC